MRGGAIYNSLYGYITGISRDSARDFAVEVHERVGKSVIWVCKRSKKGDYRWSHGCEKDKKKFLAYSFIHI